MNKDELVDYCKEASQTISELDYKNRLLEKENQELKSQLKGTTHCFDEEEHKRLSEQLELLTSKLDEYDLIVDERNQLKKQLEETDRKLFFTKNELDMRQKSIDNKLNQQKEFINYLEDEISKQKNDIFANALTSEDIDLYIMKIKLQELEEILRKCKEIIGGNKDEK